jgi:predicted neutral ceramidase superfamily lipid hydrolase
VGRKSRGTLGGIVLGGIVAATIDIGAACLITGRSVTFILHTIAGGLLAKAAYAGGIRTALLGLALQGLMGVIIAAVYAVGARMMPVLGRRWITGGLAYGVIIFFVMNYVVVPLSAWKHWPHFTPSKFLANLAAMLLFGLIVAYFVRRSSR